MDMEVFMQTGSTVFHSPSASSVSDSALVYVVVRDTGSVEKFPF
jgi:hypothetical protein